LKGITKKFGGLLAVNNVYLSVEEGHIKSIIGPNGAGKTTLFNMINGTELPDAGEIYFNGQNITGFIPSRLCKKGLVRSFQITNIFQGLCVFENIRLACQGQETKISLFGGKEHLTKHYAKTEEILKLIGLWDERETIAGYLSHADQRNLEIGIALASQPSLLLLDEPTAGMTSSESKNTIKLIERFKRKLTILLIEHDIDLVFQVSDEIAVLQYGALLAEGNPNEIRTNKKVQEAYLGEEI